ncbi:hypothetical protein VSS74_14230 [Conexibacter stalactiti]|uniref:Uncharacterized protein n=1 Tax=Conexibacter stalactiti TaxID=1940611 RepID=A0ABU4HQA4_9ACTN|nr:hypothetical protein [Conexibacter stalactiti]MDW5595503.1 hypothetical protein [Conexibacter stalactiti]MEC5036145.1 hypothetical protein [Conexibacter stalactiti]
MDRLEELQAELRRLLHSFEYAYAMGARRTMGERDPRLDWVVERVEALEREIVALRAAAADDDLPPQADR